MESLNQNKTLSPWTLWPLMVTYLWLGFVFIISFIEAPLKFSAPSLSLTAALEIGFRVFHALNILEWLCVAFLLFSLRQAWVSRSTRRHLWTLLIIQGIQTLIMYFALDPRTQAKIRGEEVSDSVWHVVYIVVEVFKVIGLIAFGYRQSKDLIAHLKTSP